MIFIRSLLFLIFFYFWLVLCLVAALPVLWLPRKYLIIFPYMMSEGILFLLAKTVGIRHEIRGLENLGSVPGILACKHQSVWETAIWPQFTPHLSIILKQELRRVPIFGILIQRLGFISVDRKDGPRAIVKMVTLAKQVIAEGRSIMIFPEGTRSQPGRPASYQRGISALYDKLEVPVIPVALNSGLFWGRKSFLKTPGLIIMEFLPPIQPGLSKDEFMEKLVNQIETATQKLLKESQAQKSGVLKHA
jgi:1-acyl-sn-glycerol-3-phosphate acyltransferase